MALSHEERTVGGEGAPHHRRQSPSRTMNTPEDKRGTPLVTSDPPFDEVGLRPRSRPTCSPSLIKTTSPTREVGSIRTRPDYLE